MLLYYYPPLFSNIFFCSSPLFLNLLYLNPVSSLIQPNLIVEFYCIHSYIQLISVSRLLSNLLCLTSVKLLSNSSLWWLFQNYRIYHILYEWVQHISWSQILPVTLFQLPVNQLWSDSEPVPVSLWNQHPTGDQTSTGRDMASTNSCAPSIHWRHV